MGCDSKRPHALAEVYSSYRPLPKTLAAIEAEDCPTREAAIAWIVANQLGRRNLTPSQKAAFALELEKQLAAEAKKRQRLSDANRIILSESEKGRARDKAAEMVGASPSYVQQLREADESAYSDAAPRVIRRPGNGGQEGKDATETSPHFLRAPPFLPYTARAGGR